jgi:hypothetical protein
MQITRAVRRSNFTVVSNEIIESTTISWRAASILIYLLSRPDGWRTSAERLAAMRKKEGRDAIRTALRELETAGYIVRSRVQGEGGKWSTEMKVFDEPQAPTQEELPMTENPSPEEDQPKTDFQPSDNQPSVSQSSLPRTDTKNSLVNEGLGSEGNSPEKPELQNQRTGWQPGSRAMTTAKSTAKLLDIQLHIVKYTVWCAQQKKSPNDGQWLSWLVRDEQEAQDKARKEQQEERRDSWYSVAD